MKKSNISSVIAWIVILAWFFLPSLAGSLEDADLGWLDNDYARITDMDYKAVVVDEPGSEGKIVVTERITFDVHAASRDNGFWELWRDLCENTVDGVKVHYKVNSVKQIMPDGTEVVWPESPQLYWDDYDYVSYNTLLGPGKWYHSEGPYNENLRQYECLLFYVDDLYREEVTFEIEYEMYNAVLRYNDCSDLYIAMYSGDTTKYLESFNAEILIPNKDMPSAGNYSITTYGTNADSFPVEESATKNPGYYTFSFDLTEDDLKFKSYNEFIEFDLVSFGDDKHAFAEYAPSNYYSQDDVLSEIYASQEEYATTAAKYRSAKSVVFAVCVLLAVIVVIIAMKKIADIKRKCAPYIPDKMLDTYREIPSDLDPNFAAELVFCKDKKRKDDSGVCSAILLSLAKKKYIDFVGTSSSNVLVYINDDDATDPSAPSDCPVDLMRPRNSTESFRGREPMTTSEKHYLNLIKRHATSDCVSMDVLQNRISMDYISTRNFVDNMKRSIDNIGVGSGYFKQADYTEPKKKLSSSATRYIVLSVILMLIGLITYDTRLGLAFGGFLILGIAYLICGIYFNSQKHKYVLLTEYGEEEYKKWRGLYNFLKSDTLIKERTVVELPLWEKYLVCATAFGISEKVIEAIKIRCPNVPTEVDGKSIVYSPYCRSGRIRSYGRSFHSSVRSGYHGGLSGVSGGYGGGSYHGGGGRGGGGGGGGH